MNRRQFTKLLAGAGLLLAGCRAGAAPSSSTPERKDSMQTTTQTYTRTTPIETVRNDPVFGDYGRLIFPVERSYYSGDTLEQLHLTYYNNIDPDETVDICNTLRQRAADGQTIFYDIYTEDEKAADPDKADTGLFYFKGNPGAKFSICNAGGAFAYVGAMQDSFPHALELLALEPQFIEEDGSVIHIRQAVKVVKGTVSIGSPKSKDSIRDIPVPLNVRPCAIKLRDTTDQFIWESPKTGLPCNPTHFRDVFRKSLEEAGDVRLLTPHSCRHTYVSQMQALGVDIQTIQSIVGHADTEMTEHYLHVQESIRQSAIQLFSEAFSA